MSDTVQVKEAYKKKLMKIPTVVGAGVGEKYVDGVSTGKPAVIVFVEKKYTQTGLISKYSAKDMVPQSLDSIPTDIIEVGKIVKQNLRKKVRPLEPGYSVGHKDITAGTIGGFFIDKDGDLVALSNNHVLANENAAKVGDPMYQPGPIDTSANMKFRNWPDPVKNLPYFGTLKKFARMNKTGNTHDSAIAVVNKKLVDLGLVSAVYPVIGKKAAGFDTAKVGDQVQKCGRTSGYTTGKVVALHGTFSVGYDFGVAEFNDCVVTTNMSRGGDSGSIIYDLDMNAVALLFAGSSKVTIANPIEIVKNYYGLKIWDGGNNDPPIVVGGENWNLFSRHGKIDFTGGVLSIEDSANHACYAERNIGRFRSIECVVNTGTDKGATWGTGMAVIWPNASMKVNLRYSGGFGGYFNNDYNIQQGRSKPETDYGLRIRKSGSRYYGEVHDGKRWVIVVVVPSYVFHGDPICVRIGKTDIRGNAVDYRGAGETGKSYVKKFKMI
jgi:hypothetical protein